MLLVSSTTRYDNWGFPHVWVPFGKPGLVKGVSGDYNVASEDILNPQSIDTLAGVPVFRWQHYTVSPDNYQELDPIGICTDKYRLTPDGGGEVLVKIVSPSVNQEIEEGSLCESSPGYMIKEGVRVYNHLTLLPKGFARGGSKMALRLEGHDTIEVYPLSTEENLRFMEEQLGLLLAETKVLSQQLAGVIKDQQEMKAMLVADATADMTEEGEDPSKAIYQEGYDAGILVGQVLSDAARHGYTGEDPIEARKHVITKAFPDMVVEGFSPDALHGLFTGAAAALTTAAIVQEVVKPAAATAEKVPAVATEKVAGKINRLKAIKSL